MSFILDALKKSESDRQRQTGPSLFEVKVAPPRRGLPLWAVAIAVLLGVNIVVISWMLLRHPATQPAVAPASAPAAAQPAVAAYAPATDPAPAPSTPGTSGPATSGSATPGPAASGSATSGSATSVSATSGPSRFGSTASGPAASGPAPPGSTADAGLAQGSAVAHGAAGGSGTSRGASAAQNVASSPQARDADRDDGAAAGDDPADHAPAVQPAAGSGASDSAADELPLYQQIVSSAGLPALHLDLHVFAERPQDRFVMINMHRLGEGDSLPGGVQVEAIRPDGVVLSYHGTRFLLPRS